MPATFEIPVSDEITSQSQIPSNILASSQTYGASLPLSIKCPSVHGHLPLLANLLCHRPSSSGRVKSNTVLLQGKSLSRNGVRQPKNRLSRRKSWFSSSLLRCRRFPKALHGKKLEISKRFAMLVEGVHCLNIDSKGSLRSENGGSACQTDFACFVSSFFGFFAARTMILSLVRWLDISHSEYLSSIVCVLRPASHAMPPARYIKSRSFFSFQI
ncbi:hypothetical protein BDW71DRAFT_184617 [Aspergillus fruticulosus]